MLKLICYLSSAVNTFLFSKGFYFVIKKNKYELQYCSVIKWGCDIVKQNLFYFENCTNGRPVKATFVWWPIHKVEAMFLFYFFLGGGGIQLYVFLHIIQYAPISFFHLRPVFVWYWRTIPFFFSSNRVLSCKCTVYEMILNGNN